MSWVEDHLEDAYFEYAMQMQEREEFIFKTSIIDLAEGILENKKLLDKRFKKMLIDISKKVLSGESLTEKQEEVLKNCYRYNDKFWED